MSRVHIDFAAPGMRRALFQLSPALWGAALVGALLCVGAGAYGYRLMQQQAERDAQLRHLEERRASQSRVVSARPASVIPAAQALAVNTAVARLNLPWRALQDAVAAATPPTVALLALEPDTRKQLLKVSAEAKTSDDMIGYVEALKQQEMFSAVRLTRHEINDQDPNRPLRFQLEATWAAR